MISKDELMRVSAEITAFRIGRRHRHETGNIHPIFMEAKSMPESIVLAYKEGFFFENNARTSGGATNTYK